MEYFQGDATLEIASIRLENSTERRRKNAKNQYCEFFNPLSIVRQKMSMMF